ncbi:MAG: helix-turn-helix domain-containing protein [Opitutaceae bacterium]|jgi:DNA-binding IclR family transcriptional regulator
MQPHTIPILKKAITLLNAVASDQEAQTTAKALSQTLKIPPSTTYRILQTFLAEDWVRQTSKGQHELSLGLLPLLQPLARHELLVETCRPILTKLAVDTGLSVKLSVRQGEHAVSVLRAESPRETSVTVRVGSVFHLTLGSSGTVLMSELSAKESQHLIDHAPKECWTHQTPLDVKKRIATFRRSGVCADFGGYQPSVYALSAAVRDGSGIIVGTVTMVGFSHDFTGRHRNAHAKHLIAATTACSNQLQRMAPSSAK